MLNWLRDRWKAKPPPSPRVPEIIDAVSRHVQDQVFAFTGGPVAPVPTHSTMTDLLIGAYIWGLLEGYIRHIPGDEPAMTQENVRATILVVANGVCSRVFGPERAQSVRRQLPQWEGPPAYHPIFRPELSTMCRRGARDGRYLAAGDPLCFAKASSLLAFMMRIAEPQI
jgi:hypothetical protein